ncbi:uncharacterized protein LOC129411007 [Boleophthalmus pectinirostris]|uniref:uncharacterized protein LOC129411007 n=1 Tax=Boleophthalmus pectinirostris TaxID=150288 RepID=UPI00242E0790|nr:uncharacterized protein LOC129411007 [Boleophthalmus pectinirostris]
MYCTDSSCSSQSPQICSSSQTLCYTSAVNDSGTITITKGCTYPGDWKCSDGGFFYSYNLGSSFLQNTTCCDSHQCNSAQLPIPAPPAGSLQCYGWDPDTEVSTANVTCNVQEVCGGFVTSNLRPLYGCVSENICNSSLTTAVSMGQSYVSLSQSTVCCNTSHCNPPELGPQCNYCSGSTCSNDSSVTCSKTSACFTRTRTYYYTDGSNYTYMEKGCISENLCPAAEPEIFSYKTGYNTETFFCCRSDHCNAPTQPTPPAGPLQCYGCDLRQETADT